MTPLNLELKKSHYEPNSVARIYDLKEKYIFENSWVTGNRNYFLAIRKYCKDWCNFKFN